MFTKLLKHEIKATYKLRGILLAAVFAISILYYIANSLHIRFISPLIGFFLFCSIGGSIVIMQILILTRYYSSMYGKSGYLSHTLPIKPSYLLYSKLLSDSVWLILSFITSFISSKIFFPELVWKSLAANFQALLSEIGIEQGSWIVGLLVGAGVVLMALYSLSMIYLSISLGCSATFHGLRLGGPVLMYIANYIVQQITVTLSFFIPIVVIFQQRRVQIAFRQTWSLFTSDSIPEPGVVPFMVFAIWPCFVIVQLIWTQYLVKKKVSLR